MWLEAGAVALVVEEAELVVRVAVLAHRHAPRHASHAA